jgi:hypothetical protein
VSIQGHEAPTGIRSRVLLARPDEQVARLAQRAGLGASEILLARQQAELAARQLKLENCRVAVAELMADYPPTAVTDSDRDTGCLARSCE